MLRNYSYSKISIGAVTIKSIGANRIKAIVCGNIACIFHTLGKKPLIDEWHTPAKAVFSFYDKSLQP